MIHEIVCVENVLKGARSILVRELVILTVVYDNVYMPIIQVCHPNGLIGLSDFRNLLKTVVVPNWSFKL